MLAPWLQRMRDYCCGCCPAGGKKQKAKTPAAPVVPTLPPLQAEPDVVVVSVQPGPTNGSNLLPGAASATNGSRPVLAQPTATGTTLPAATGGTQAITPIGQNVLQPSSALPTQQNIQQATEAASLNTSRPTMGTSRSSSNIRTWADRNTPTTKGATMTPATMTSRSSHGIEVPESFSAPEVDSSHRSMGSIGMIKRTAKEAAPPPPRHPVPPKFQGRAVVSRDSRRSSTTTSTPTTPTSESTTTRVTLSERSKMQQQQQQMTQSQQSASGGSRVATTATTVQKGRNGDYENLGNLRI